VGREKVDRYGDRSGVGLSVAIGAAVLCPGAGFAQVVDLAPPVPDWKSDEAGKALVVEEGVGEFRPSMAFICAS
jgi:hypothetical protein